MISVTKNEVIYVCIDYTRGGRKLNRDKTLRGNGCDLDSAILS